MVDALGRVRRRARLERVCGRAAPDAPERVSEHGLIILGCIDNVSYYAVLQDTKSEPYSAGAPKALLTCTDRISVETATGRRGHKQAELLPTMLGIASDLSANK
jgi:hypothetical protein